MLNKRLVLTSNKTLSIVSQDKNLGDAENFAASRSDEQTLRQIGAFGNSYSVETVAKYMPEPSIVISNKRIFTIIANDNGRYLGDIRIIRLDDYNYELGIVIIEPERCKGYGSQAILLASKYCFEHLGAHSIQLRVYHNNPRAKALYLRLGFEYKATQYDGYIVEGEPVEEDLLVLHNW